MMNNNVFITSQSVGQLFIDHIILEYEFEPIISICRDRSNKLYFTLCSEFRDLYRWLIVPVSIYKLKKYINREICTYDMFISDLIILIEQDFDEKQNECKLLASDVPSQYLPLNNSYLRNISKESVKYVSNLHSKDITFSVEEKYHIQNKLTMITGAKLLSYSRSIKPVSNNCHSNLYKVAPNKTNINTISHNNMYSVKKACKYAEKQILVH